VTPPETVTVAVELAELRGELRTGLADIKGSLGVLVERTVRTDADLKQLRTDTEADIKQLRTDTASALEQLRADTEALKRGRWPLPALSVLAGLAAVVVAIIALYR
jgi:hypothetical protein